MKKLLLVLIMVPLFSIGQSSGNTEEFDPDSVAVFDEFDVELDIDFEHLNLIKLDLETSKKDFIIFPGCEGLSSNDLKNCFNLYH